MDIIFEFVFELILEGIFGLTIKNPKVKSWTKTVIFILLSEAVALLILWMAFQAASIVVGLIGLALALGFLDMAVDGHKRDWKQE